MHTISILQPLLAIGAEGGDYFQRVLQSCETQGIPYRKLSLSEAADALAGAAPHTYVLIVLDLCLTPEMLQGIFYAAHKRKLKLIAVGGGDAAELWERLVPLELPEFFDAPVLPHDGDWADILSSRVSDDWLKHKNNSMIINKQQKISKPCRYASAETQGNEQKADTCVRHHASCQTKDMPFYTLVTVSLAALVLSLVAALMSLQQAETYKSFRLQAENLHAGESSRYNELSRSVGEVEGMAKKAADQSAQAISDMNGLKVSLDAYKEQASNADKGKDDVIAAYQAFLNAKATELENKATELDEKAKALDEKAKALDEKAEALDRRTTELERKATELDEKAEALDRRTTELENKATEQEKGVRDQEGKPEPHRCPSVEGVVKGDATYQQIQKGADDGCETCKRNLVRITEPSPEPSPEPEPHRCPSVEGVVKGDATYQQIQKGADDGCATCKRNLERIPKPIPSHVCPDPRTARPGRRSFYAMRRYAEQGCPTCQRNLKLINEAMR